jgi:WD40 repeat protein
MAGPAAYDAFISYSRAVDGGLAPALQSALQRFGKPWYRPRAKRVFRDDASLAANPGLWSSIEHALDGASWFVLLASPGAAQSEYVAAEVTHWLAGKPADRVLLVLTRGEIEWDDAAGDFDWTRTDALPRALAGAFAEEPRYIDVRWAQTREHLSLSDPRFREAVADVAAPLHGRPKDELIGEEVRQHRRTVRLARGAVALLSGLLVAAVLAALFAIDQRNTARAERDRAEEQARIATSRSLADAALQTFDQELGLGLLLALEAYRLEPTAEGRDAVVTALQRSDRIERTLPDDPDGVLEVAVQPGSAVAVARGIDGGVTVWDTRRGRMVARLPLDPEAGEAESVAVRRDGLIALGGLAGVTLWDAAGERRIARLRGNPAVSVAFSPDGTRLASAGYEGGVELWDVEARERLRRLDARVPELFALATDQAVVRFAPDGRAVAFGGAGGTIRVWRDGEELRLRAGESDVHALAFAPDAPVLASGAANGSIRLWDLFTGTELPPPLDAHPGGVNALAFAERGLRLVSAGEDGAVRVWEPFGGSTEPVDSLTGHSREVTGVAFGPGGSLVTSGQDGTVRVWRAGPESRFAEPLDAGRRVDRVALSPDGRVLAGGGGFGVVRFWDAATLEPLSGWLDAGGGEGVTDLDFDGSGRLLASSSPDGLVRLWDVAARRPRGPPLEPVDDPQGYSESTPLALSRDGRLLASGASESVVELWDARRREHAAAPLADPGFGSPAAVAFGPDGRTLAFSTQDGSITLWDVERRRLRGAPMRARGIEGLSFISTLAFSPDGRHLVSGGDDDRIRFWDVRRRRALGEPLRGHRDWVRSVAFTPDGATLASGAEDGTVRLWDSARRRPLGEPLASGARRVTSVAFSPDGARLAVATGGTRVLLFDHALWPSTPEQAAARLCAAAGRTLTESEWAEFVPVAPYERICPAA